MLTNINLLNHELKKIATIYSIPLLDTYSIFLDKNGEANPIYFQDDGLHLSKEGYETWVNNVLIPYLTTCDCASVAMVGNSITLGIDGYDFGITTASQSNWELLLHIKAFNLGVGGNTSYDIIYRLDHIVAYKADCYFLLIGINDINSNIQIWQTVKNIDYIVDYLEPVPKTGFSKTVIFNG